MGRFRKEPDGSESFDATAADETEAERSVLCDVCNGSGLLDVHTLCPACDGHGLTS